MNRRPKKKKKKVVGREGGREAKRFLDRNKCFVIPVTNM
jgi:hypothetical protein